MSKVVNLDEKRANEKKVVTQMITIYCKKNHKCKELCEDCQKLLEFSYKRIENCPNMETKTFCASCERPCYGGKNKEDIRQVMKFSGRYMLLYHPIITVKHMREMIKNKKTKA